MKLTQDLSEKKQDFPSQQKSSRKLKVAFYVYPTAFQSPGGGEIQLLKTKQYLENEGVEVKLFDQWTDRLESFDVFHLFGAAKECVKMVETAKILGVKTVLSTICWYSWKSAWWTYPSFKGRLISMARQFAKSFFQCPTFRFLSKKEF